MKFNQELIKKYFKGLSQKLGRNLLIIFVLFLLLDLCLGFVFFYRYYWKGIEKEVELPPPLKLNQALLNKFSSERTARENALKEIENKVYPDPFRGFAIEESAGQ